MISKFFENDYGCILTRMKSIHDTKNMNLVVDDVYVICLNENLYMS